MRIGIDARFYGSLGKGLGRYTEKLIEHLERIDDNNEYVVFLRKENYEEYRPKRSRFKKVLAHFSWYSFSEQVFFPFLLYRMKLELVHFPHFNVPLLYRKKFIVTIHDLILLHHPTLRNTTRGVFLYALKFLAYRAVIASAVKRSAAIITVSHFTEKDILKHYPKAAGKISVTYEAADPYCHLLSRDEEKKLFLRLGLIDKEKGLGGHTVLRDILRPYLLYVGNAYPHKNLEILLKAAQRMKEHTFVLVGKEDYFYARLKKEAKERALQNVIFSGFLTDQELGSLYQFARLYVFPSLYEGFGLPPLEAMSRGLPVISSDRGSLPEILGSAALYFDPSDAEALESAIRSFEGNKEQERSMQQAGYTRAAGFSFQKMAEETHTIYQNVFKNTL